jgi:hypothetical protein
MKPAVLEPKVPTAAASTVRSTRRIAGCIRGMLEVRAKGRIMIPAALRDGQGNTGLQVWKAW